MLMEKINIVFDGNFCIHKAFAVWSTYYQERKKTPEENEQAVLEALLDKEKQQVFLRKIIIDLCAAVRRFSEKPDSVVVVIDSHSWRYKFHDDYKYALTKIRTSYYKEFCAMIDYVEQYLRKKGIIVSRVPGAEGDDLLYMWSIYYNQVLEESCVIVTGDSDIRQIMNTNIAIFNNNSKNLHLYCTPDREVYWNERMEADVLVEPTIPFEVILYKVIMGDKSDNIPKLKSGIGDVAFKKFIASISPYTKPEEGTTLTAMSMWIADRFAKFANLNYEETLGKVLFNLKMTWLNLETYNGIRVCGDLLVNMLDDIKHNKDTYSYNKAYTLEDFYGMIIK